MNFPGAAYEVDTGSARYPGYVGWGILDTLGERMRALGLQGTVHVIADAAVAKLYRSQVETALNKASFGVGTFTFPSGEQEKTLATAEKAYAWLASRRAERRDVIVALGGGVAGDVAGFVAATYLRGMAVVQVPTTLLAMVDSSLGGKTGVDLPVGKNLIGAFHQPRMVLADTQTLTTLPARELTSGWAELIKHALIMDRGLLDYIEEHAQSLRQLDQVATVEAVSRSASIKARVVSEDPLETTGLRSLLNYGHTTGHALETALGYGVLLHGEAIAIGMTTAASISRAIGMLSAKELEQQDELLRAFGLPLSAPRVSVDKVKAAMTLDKKVAGKRINWVLLEHLGAAKTRNDIPDEVIDTALRTVIG